MGYNASARPPCQAAPHKTNHVLGFPPCPNNSRFLSLPHTGSLSFHSSQDKLSLSTHTFCSSFSSSHPDRVSVLSSSSSESLFSRLEGACPSLVRIRWWLVHNAACGKYHVILLELSMQPPPLPSRVKGYIRQEPSALPCARKMFFVLYVLFHMREVPSRRPGTPSIVFCAMNWHMRMDTVPCGEGKSDRPKGLTTDGSNVPNQTMHEWSENGEGLLQGRR